MNPEPRSRAADAAILAALAALPVVAMFLAQARIGIDLADEGYLWYGAQAVLRGDVPMRDFQSYDPARYYWAALWLKLLGDGIVSLRAGYAVLHVAGTLAGLLALRRVTRSTPLLAAASVLITLWFYPRFSMNHVVALVGVWTAVRLIEQPTLRRHLLAGVWVGVAAMAGRNLGVYAAASFAFLLVAVWWRGGGERLARRALAWGVGVAAGYAPMLLAFAFVPGFWTTQLEWLRFVAASGTNLDKPVPWPWTVSTPYAFAVGLLFVCVPLFHAAAVAWLAGGRGRIAAHPVVAAALFVGAPYLHYMFSRPDVQHLGGSVQPVTIGVLAVGLAAGSKAGLRRLVLVAFAALSLVVAGRNTDVFQKVARPAGSYEGVQLGASAVEVLRRDAELIAAARRIDARIGADPLMIAPYFPGLYAVLERPAPVWQVYLIVPEPEAGQRRMIEEIERSGVRWILFADLAFDGRKDLGFRRTHPLVWEYVTSRFALARAGLPPRFYLLRRR